MGDLCKTTVDDAWDSTIAGTLEGTFGIREEDAEGFFEGHFQDNDGVVERIRGKCDGTTIYFLRSAEKPRFYYIGNFREEDRKIIGVRTSLPQAEDTRVRTEEWEGTKVPTEERADSARQNP